MPTRERTIRAESIVLRHSDWGEADRFLVIFTRELGKVRAIAKGVRKPRSRKVGHLEPSSLQHPLDSEVGQILAKISLGVDG